MSTRAAVPDLVSSRPLIELLPALYHEDGFAQRWLAALDTVIAPIETTLDCFTSYLDPAIAPEDFLAWTGTWLGAILDDDMTIEQRRALVGEVVEIYGLRGTAAGISRLVELSLPVTCEVIEGGGATASTVPGSALPGTQSAAFIVEIRTRTGSLSDHQQRRAVLLVEATRPAHLPAVVEFPSGGSGAGSTGTEESR
jgi:phage tail-like protein